MRPKPAGYATRRQRLIDNAVLWLFGMMIGAAVALLKLVRRRPRV